MQDLKLLTVDDDGDFSGVLRLNLSREGPGLSIVSLPGARECLGYLSSRGADCIISDYKMDGMDGMELLLALRGRGDDIPFIFLTAQGSEEVAREAFKNGADDYFAKEYSLAFFPRLLRSVRHAVECRTAHDLYDNVPCGQHSLDKDGMIIKMNRTELSWLGYTKDEAVGRMNFADVITPESVETFRKNFPAFKERGFVRDLEFTFLRKDGTSFPALLSATAVRDKDGNYLMSRSVVYDISNYEIKKCW